MSLILASLRTPRLNDMHIMIPFAKCFGDYSVAALSQSGHTLTTSRPASGAAGNWSPGTVMDMDIFELQQTLSRFQRLMVYS
jgi:hypothetical protein